MQDKGTDATSTSWSGQSSVNDYMKGRGKENERQSKHNYSVQYRKQYVPDRRYKRVICNQFNGYDPKGMVIRAAIGLAFFMNNNHDLRRICGPIENDLTYQTFRRAFDVDFVNHELWVSIDGVEESKRKLNAGEIGKAQFSDSLMWQDTDFGQLLIDITGVDGSATARYAFVKNIYDTGKCYSVEEYLELHKTGQDDQIMAAVKGFNEYATIMTLEEV